MLLAENIIDTVLNAYAFVFIGVLIWLYLRKEPDSHASDEEKKHKQG